MAKRVKAGALDESMIIQSFKDDNLIADPASAVRSEPGAPIPSAEPRHDAAEVSASAPRLDLDRRTLILRNRGLGLCRR